MDATFPKPYLSPPPSFVYFVHLQACTENRVSLQHFRFRDPNQSVTPNGFITCSLPCVPGGSLRLSWGYLTHDWSVLLLHKPLSNFITIAERLIAFDLLSPKLRKHDCYDETNSLNSKWSISFSTIRRWPCKMQQSVAMNCITETLAREHFMFWTTHWVLSHTTLLCLVR